VAVLVDLVHRRWNVPIVAELFDRAGAKFVTLVRATGASRSSIAASLTDLIALGYVCRNPGYGHPLRPEYLLTAAGERIAPACHALHTLLRKRGEEHLGFRKWTLPLVAAIGPEGRRFNELRHTLEIATPRAITLSLKPMLRHDWIKRPPAARDSPPVGYELRPKGRTVLDRLDGLY